MEAFIISGGHIETSQLNELYKQRSKDNNILVIAADKGIEVCIALGIKPDYIIGDFDSAPSECLEYYSKFCSNVIVLNPVKDDTDTEAALQLAYEHSDGDIYVFGATGGRLDHFMGNIALLLQGCEKGRKVFILDNQNRISLFKDKIELQKNNQFGRYVSFIPWGGNARGVTLKGFKYCLDNAELRSDNTLGISNEIVDAEAYVFVEKGYLLIVESKDSDQYN